MQTVVGQFQRISFLIIIFLINILHCNAYLSWTEFQSCAAITLLSQNWVENYCQLFLRIALVAFIVDGPYDVCSGFHGYCLALHDTPGPKHPCPYSLSTDKKAEVIIHSTFIQQHTEEKCFAFLLPFQLKENISSPFLLLSLIWILALSYVQGPVILAFFSPSLHFHLYPPS